MDGSRFAQSTAVPFYRDFLREEISKRCERNPRYSARAFARAIEIDPGALCRVLAGKQIPSLKLSKKILSSLATEPEHRKDFLESVILVRKSHHLQRVGSCYRALELESQRAAHLSVDHYRIIADWYHFAILEIIYDVDFQSKPRWIASQLGIGATEAKLAIERLFKLGLLIQKNGKWTKASCQLTSAQKYRTTGAHRKNQKQFLEKSIHSLENDPIEMRNHSSMTMAIDPDKLPEAKKMIREFNRELCRFLESGKRKRVYNLSVSLYPLEKERK